MRPASKSVAFSVEQTVSRFANVLQTVVLGKPQLSKVNVAVNKQSQTIKPKLSILGCRGIPANYGGFETFAERLSLYLTSLGWEVTVYCQKEDCLTQEVFESYWKGIRLIHIPVAGNSSTIASIAFDWRATLHAARQKNLILTLGYNTAVFCFWYRLKGLTNIINMDGLEWRRSKWQAHEKAWLYLNERLGCWFGNHLVADHPEIKTHLTTRVSSKKVTVIPYGAEQVVAADKSLLEQYDLVANEYAIVIARPEPENNILEIVSAFSSKPRKRKLVVLGRYRPDIFPYHKKVMKAASDEVIFLGEQYEHSVVSTLRFYTKLYIHGHTVGGTNPSLVEALAAGSPVLAHENSFNSWVAGPGNHYFKNQEDCAEKIDQLLKDEESLQQMKQASLRRYHEKFSSQEDVKLYEALLTVYAQS